MTISWDLYQYANITGYREMIDYANTVTGYSFGAMFMISIFIVMYAVMRNEGDMKAFTASSLITTIIGMLLFAAGLVANWLVILFVFMTALLAFLAKKE